MNWDETLLRKFNNAIYEINKQIQRMKGKEYGSMEIKRKEHYESIIKTNSEEISRALERFSKFENIKAVLDRANS